jgi:hypothetical protein
LKILITPDWLIESGIDARHGLFQPLNCIEVQVPDFGASRRSALRL